MHTDMHTFLIQAEPWTELDTINPLPTLTCLLQSGISNHSSVLTCLSHCQPQFHTSDHLHWVLAWPRPITNHALGSIPAVSVAKMGTVFAYALRCKNNNLALSIPSPCLHLPLKEWLPSKQGVIHRLALFHFPHSSSHQKTSLALNFCCCWTLCTPFLRCFCCFGLFPWVHTLGCLTEVRIRRGRLYLEFSGLRIGKPWILDQKNAEVC